LKFKLLVTSLLTIFLNVLLLKSQSREIIVKTTNKSITIDGLADDKAWDEANQIDDFFQHFPTDSLKAELKTSIKIIRDESNIYLLARSETKNKNM
jgi:hypothetical protein